MKNSDKTITTLTVYPSVKISELFTDRGFAIILNALKENQEGSINYGVMYKRFGEQVFIKPYKGCAYGPKWEEGWYGINAHKMREYQEGLNIEEMTDEEFNRYQEYEASLLSDIIIDEITSIDRHRFFSDVNDLEDLIMNLVKQWSGTDIGISYKVWPTHVDFSFGVIGKEIGYDGTDGWQTRIYNNKTVDEVTKIILAETREKIKK